MKEVLNDSGKLAECVNKSLAELEERRKEIGAESMAVESKLEADRAREERLGMAFADGTVNESVYRSKLKRLRRVEIKGAIPTQMLDKTNKEENKTTQIITSPSPGKGGDKNNI